MQDFINRHLYNRTFLSYILLPLSLIYILIQLSRRLLYQMFPRLRFRSSCKIISVGNIISGGSGKTPFTIFMTGKLIALGHKVAVSHRGYKGEFENENRLISDFDKVFPEAKRAGDEACLLANKLAGVPVITGKSRKRSIQILLERFSDLEYIILDDSFQHLKVDHYRDFVIINETGGIGNGFVLPAGILREPVSVLKYADWIIFNGRDDIPEYLNKYRKKLIKGHYEINGIFDLSDKKLDIDLLRTKKIVLMSGIGKPQSFEKTIREVGLEFCDHLRFPDHYNYKDSCWLNEINSCLEVQEFDLIVTTEKDLVKIGGISDLPVPIAVLKIQFFTSDEQFIKLL